MPAHPELSGPWPTVERLSSADYPSDGPPGAMLNLARAANREDRRELRDRALAAATNDPHLAFQVQAEEAVDAAARNDLQRARQLADAVLEAAADAISVARATEALGRAELWSGTHSGRVRGIRLMEEAIGLFRELGSREWAGWGLTWLGYAGYYLAGELAQAVDHMRRGLDLIESPHRRVTALAFLADALCDQGDWDGADEVLDAAYEICPSDFSFGWDYLAWGRARVASARGDRVGTVRALAEVSQSRGPWLETIGGSGFLSEAAVLLARVGDLDGAREWLGRAQAHPIAHSDVRRAEAELQATYGNPEAALETLQTLPYHDGPWESRLDWRLDLLRAVALLRAGRAEHVPGIAAAVLEHADKAGALMSVGPGESAQLAVLAPFAMRAGSPHAGRILSSAGWVLTLMGCASLSRDLESIGVPPGKPGELLRLVACAPAGVLAERAVDRLWPEASAEAGQKALRNALHRLNGAVGEAIVVRDGPRLRVNAVWVDLTHFEGLAQQALRQQDLGLVNTALALWSGDPLDGDLYADWANEYRGHLQALKAKLVQARAELLHARPWRE